MGSESFISISTPPFRILFKPRREIASLIGIFDIYYFLSIITEDFTVFPFFPFFFGRWVFFIILLCVFFLRVFSGGIYSTRFVVVVFFTHLA